MGLGKINRADLKEFFEETNLAGMYETIQGQMRRELIIKMEYIVVTGLQRKGFDFNNRYELELFLKERCRATDNPRIKERVYFVGDIPFLIHYYKVTVDSQTDRNKITASGGSYRYL